MQEQNEPKQTEQWMYFLLQEHEQAARLYEDLFQAAMEITNLPIAHVVRLRHETHLRIEALVDRLNVGLQASQEFPLDSLLCNEVLKRGDSLLIADVARSAYARHPAVQRYGIRTYIGTPIYLRDHRPYGVLSLWDRELRVVGREELLRVSLLSRYLAHEIELRQLQREVSAKNGRLAVLNQELQRLNAQIEQGSIRDPVTDLLNSRYFNKLLQTETARARRHAYPLTLLLLYPDGFQALTRQWGTEVGNNVLASIGVLLRRHLRNIDSAARYTEEIFAILLPQTDLSGATIVADRTRMTIASHRFTQVGGQNNGVNLTVSIGLSDLVPTEDNMAMGMLSRARHALEQARNAGGNRVAVFQTANPA